MRETLAAAATGLRPRPYLPVSQWAEKERWVPAECSDDPGWWDNSRAPYLREVMDALSPLNPCREVYVQKCAQSGFTEAAINLIGYHIDYWPCGMLLVMSDEATVKKTSKQKITPTIKQSPALASKVIDRQGKLSRDNLYDKEFPGGFLQMTWASSASGLASTSVPVVIADEYARWPKNSGGEGDPTKLIRRRIQNFRNSKIFGFSTPTIRGQCHIEKARKAPNATDERLHLPCPHCEHYQELKLENLVFDKVELEPGKYRVERAVYACCNCGSEIDERHKKWMLNKYKWVAMNPKADGTVRSFWLTGLYIPRAWLSWQELGQEWLDSKGDYEAMKAFTNTVMGETFAADDGVVLEAADIPGIGEDYDVAEQGLPEEALILTMAVDVQGDRLEGEVVAWGEGHEAWGVEYFVADGEPSDLTSPDSPWRAVSDRLDRRWDHPTLGPQRIVRTMIDSRGHHTKSVYAYVRPRQSRQVYAIAGSPTPGKPPISRGKARTGGVTLVTIGTEGLKDFILGRLQEKVPGPGFWHFPAKYPPQYFEQLTAETRVEAFSRGKPVTQWKLKQGKKRNEALDIRVYNCAALEMLGEINWDSIRANAEQSKKAKPRADAAAARRKAGFVSSWRK